MKAWRTAIALGGIGALLSAGIVLLVTPGVGAAASDPIVVTSVSWWTLATAAPKASGGFQVAESPNNTGDMSVAAVKLQINAAHLGSALFVLNEAKTSIRPDGGGIVACLSASDWKAGNPGLWTDAPKRDCARQVQMVRSATQQAWSADLLPLLVGKTGVVSIVFAPGTPGAGSIPIPTLETLPLALPSLPIPVVGGVPLPPPAVAALLPPLPSSVAAPVQLGYTVDFSNLLVGATEAGAALAPPGGGIDAGVDTAGISFFDNSDSSLASAPPLAATTQATGSQDEQLALPAAAVHGPGRPWGRAWGFAILALLVGGAISAGRRVVRERLE